jgi:hypothetical protein
MQRSDGISRSAVLRSRRTVYEGGRYRKEGQGRVTPGTTAHDDQAALFTQDEPFSRRVSEHHASVRCQEAPHRSRHFQGGFLRHLPRRIGEHQIDRLNAGERTAFVRMTPAAPRSASTSVTCRAPRDSASSPSAPLPAYRSTTQCPLRSPRIENKASRTRSSVGRVTSFGHSSLRPRNLPAMMRTTASLAPHSASGSVGVDLAPHLAAPFLPGAVGARDPLSHVPGRQ